MSAWVVEVRYPRLTPHGDDSLIIRWKFKVDEVIQRADGLWWRVQVTDADGITPYAGEFLLEPDKGMIESIRLRELVRGQWHEQPLQLPTPTAFHIQTFGPLPLDYVGKTAISLKETTTGMGKNAGEPLYCEVQNHGDWQFRREYNLRSESADPVFPKDQINALKQSSVAGIRLVIQDAHHPSQVREMVWSESSPWWSECQTPAYSARLVEIIDADGVERHR